MTLMAGTLMAATCALALAAWHAAVTRRSLLALESRLARQADALALLTETSETGFSVVAQELTRLGAAPAKPARRQTSRRLTAAAKRGRSTNEIAASEGLSEGEVHLRLQLASHSASDDDARGW